MLLSIMLSLSLIEDSKLEGYYGRQVQGWLLHFIAKFNEEIVEEMHKNNGMRPYTVSNLLFPKESRWEDNGRMRLAAGTECQIRITSLTEEFSELLVKDLLPNLPRRIRLKWSEFRNIHVVHQNQWTGMTTFEQLVEQSEKDSGVSAILDLASPTAFRTGNVDLTLPVPEQVWRSLWWRWNHFAPENLKIDSIWARFAENCIVVSDYLLQAKKIYFKKGAKGAVTGATGQITYSLLPSKNCGEYAEYRLGADLVMRTLANFAMYSGVGHHTTIGLGQTRVLVG